MIKIFKGRNAICLILGLIVFKGFLKGEIVDRIVSVVNGEVITLLDVKVVQRFSLFTEEGNEPSEDTYQESLEYLINLKIVMTMVAEKVVVSNEEVDSLFQKITMEIGLEEMEKRMFELGLDEEALKLYLREKIFYEKIISQRFSGGIRIALSELEDYYREKYIPQRKELDLEVLPLVDVLDEVEALIRKDKISKLKAEWLAILRKQADIMVNK